MANKIRLNHGAGVITEETLDPVISLRNIHNDLVFDSLSDIPDGIVGPVWVDKKQLYFDNDLHFSNLQPPRTIKNQILASKRFETGNTYGTGVVTIIENSSDAGIKDYRLRCETGLAGRARANLDSNPLVAGEWYALSFEVFEFSHGADLSGNICAEYTSNNVDRGSVTIPFSNLVAGGIGRYATFFRAAASANINIRIGASVTSDANGQTVVVGNYMLERINPDMGFYVSEYVYPGFTAAYNYVNNLAVDPITNKVSSGNKIVFPVMDYSNVLMVGDSRVAGNTGIGAQLQNLMLADGSGNCLYHAKGGWKVEDLINDSVEWGITFNLQTCLDGTALRMTVPTADERGSFNYVGDVYRFDTIIIADFGYNSIYNKVVGQSKSSIDAAIETMDDIAIICQEANKRCLKVICTDNNPIGSLSGVTQETIDAIKLLNRLIEQYCRTNGFDYVAIYEALSDSTNQDDMSATYTSDGLHPNTDGYVLIAEKIKYLLDARK